MYIYFILGPVEHDVNNLKRRFVVAHKKVSLLKAVSAKHRSKFVALSMVMMATAR
jgi:hypothetical protein